MRRAILSLLALAAVATLAGSTRADPPTFVPAPPDRVWERRPIAAPAPRIELVDDGMRTLPTFAHEGRRFVLGGLGERYRIRIVNPTATRVEAVISVDGLDALDGHPASFAKSGYVIPAFGDVTIDGWRTSLDTVAAFRFSSVRDSYASRTDHERNVGVIGVAFFRERPPIVWRGPVPSAAAPKSAGAAGDLSGAHASRAEGLGTRFGESHDSHVFEVSFDRADTTPSTVAELRYDDREGLLARGIPLPPLRDGRWASVERRDGAQAFPDQRFAQPPR